MDPAGKNRPAGGEHPGDGLRTAGARGSVRGRMNFQNPGAGFIIKNIKTI